MSDQHGKTIVELEMDGGELIWVSPPSFMVVNALRADISAKYPEIDESAYRVPLEGALVAGETYIPPESAEAYQAAKLERDTAINKALSRAVMEIAVNHPDGRDVVIARYKSDIELVRQRLTLEESDWYIAVHYFLVTTLNNFNTVMGVVNRDLPLTEPEVAHGLRMFRRAIRQYPVGQASDDAAGTAESARAPLVAGRG